LCSFLFFFFVSFLFFVPLVEAFAARELLHAANA